MPTQSPIIVGNYSIDSAATDKVITRFDDGSGSNPATKTTFGNQTNATRALLFEVTP